jgi:beta-mannosidase
VPDALPTVRPLHDGWSVTPLAERGVPEEVLAAWRIPATVPGVVHTDLLAAGLIADPLHGTNERCQEWIGSTPWRYATTFDADLADERVDLVFAGLDTVATVSLNGTVILESRDQHRSFRVPVRHLLRPTGNDLVVEFAAPVPYADAESLRLGYRPHVNHHPYNAIRKMACSFGWDWGPDTATSGIWRPVTLESWSHARLATVRPVATVDGATGRVAVHVAVERASDEPLTLTATVGGAAATAVLGAGETTAVLGLSVADARLWWPVGYGDQARYDLAVTLATGGTLLDRADRRIGFRDVRLDTTPDADGAPLALVVNGRPVWAKGVNWIPDDPFPHRIDGARYARRLDQAVAANVNLVRVWGGGIYESEDFYDAADERGLLVWQDFLFACAAYAEEEPLRSEVEAEAREAVARLGSHPSLVVLNGCNENLWGYEEWGWQPRLEGRTWGAGYYHELLPAIVAELAPHVAYTPGSPFSPVPGDAANSQRNGSMHLWDEWNTRDYTHYRDYAPRFVAEFGWQGPPAWSTLAGALDDDPLTPESPGMLVHQKAALGNVKLTDGLLPHLPLPNTMPEWHWAMVLNQANAVRAGLAHFRSLAPHCGGAIVWQLNDCWPVVSWAAVDSAGRRKPLWYAMREAFAPRLLTVEPEGDRLVLAVVNDTAAEWAGSTRVVRHAFDGAVLDEATVEVAVGPYRSARLPLPVAVATPGEPSAELLRAELDGARAEWFFAEYRDSRLRAAELDVEVVPAAGGLDVVVTARSLVRDLTVLADVVDPDAEADRALVTLLPGGTATIHVDTRSSELAAFGKAPALRTANDLVG